jgi:hypothetical protein
MYIYAFKLLGPIKNKWLILIRIIAIHELCILNITGFTYKFTLIDIREGQS